MSKSIRRKLKQLNEEKGGLFENLIFRHVSAHITSILVHTSITPNIVTSLSTTLAFIAAFFYLKADYFSLVIGTVFLNLSNLFDCVDGELSRYKNLSSTFGAWLDSISDRVVEYIIFSSLTLGLYFRTGNLIVLIIGLFALANILMISCVRIMNRVYFDPRPNHEFKVSENRYVGGMDTFTLTVTIITLVNQVYYFLLIFSILGAVIWIRQIIRSALNNYNT